jgi:COP9 signalosome complex subunit 6
MTTPMNISEAGAESNMPVGNARVGSVSGTADQPREDGSLLLHPLVVINISDHFNRFAAMRLFGHPHAPFDGESPPPVLVDCHGNIRVIGILLGNQDGRTVEISHSFELPGKLANNFPDDHTVVVDVEFAQLRIDQYKQIFPDYHVVGWYTTGSSVTADDIRLHKDVFSVLNESPFLMLVNVAACMKSLAGRLTSSRETSQHAVVSSSSARPAASLDRASVLRGAPHPTSAIVIYQAELRSVDSLLQNVMVPVPHRFASADSERIAVDHVTRHAVPGGGSSSASQHLGSLRRSVRMLSARIDVLVRFLDASAKGDIPKDHTLLRNVAAVCARLPAIESEEFATAFKEEHHDSMVVSYLSGVTKSLCAMNELVDTFQFVYDKPSGGVGGGGVRRRM